MNIATRAICMNRYDIFNGLVILCPNYSSSAGVLGMKKQRKSVEHTEEDRLICNHIQLNSTILMMIDSVTFFFRFWVSLPCLDQYGNLTLLYCCLLLLFFYFFTVMTTFPIIEQTRANWGISNLSDVPSSRLLSIHFHLSILLNRYPLFGIIYFARKKFK